MLENKEFDAWLTDRVKKWLEGDLKADLSNMDVVMNSDRKEGLHLYDILYPRQAYFRSKDPKELGKAEVGLFSAGKIGEMLIVSMLPDGAPKEVTFDGLVGGIDFLAEGDVMDESFDGHVVYEIKTSRSWKTVLPDNYLTQVAQYAAAYMDETGNVPRCRVVTFFLTLKEDRRQVPQFISKDIIYTEEEILQVIGEMQDTHKRLVKGMEDDDHTGIPECGQTSGATYLCTYCKWSGDCLL